MCSPAHSKFAVVVAPRFRRSGECKAASDAHVGRLYSRFVANGFKSSYAAACTSSTENSNCAGDAIRKPLSLSTADGFIWTSRCCPASIEAILRPPIRVWLPEIRIRAKVVSRHQPVSAL